MDSCRWGLFHHRWDDLEGEARRDAVARTHNVVFSQLASIAFNMLECGVDGGRVRSDVTRKCKESQLGEMQVIIVIDDPYVSCFLVSHQKYVTSCRGLDEPSRCLTRLRPRTSHYLGRYVFFASERRVIVAWCTAHDVAVFDV